MRKKSTGQHKKERTITMPHIIIKSSNIDVTNQPSRNIFRLYISYKLYLLKEYGFKDILPQTKLFKILTTLPLNDCSRKEVVYLLSINPNLFKMDLKFPELQQEPR